MSLGNDYIDYSVVWLTEYRTFGWLLQQGAHFSKVVYYDDLNQMQEEQIENDEYITWEEKAINYESN